MGIRLSDLNPPQRQAVTTTEGPLLVLAGAGSGKTRVITYRIVYLLERGVRPENILAVSFTNKAADEMRERVERLLAATGDRSRPASWARGLTLSTFHSLGLLLLKAEAATLGLHSGFSIYDTADQIGVIRDVLRDAHIAGRKLDIKAVLSRISRCKNGGLSPQQFIEQVKRARIVHEYDGFTAEIYPRYQARMRALCAFDFDDLLVETLRLLQDHEDVRRRWQQRFQYLMIDEYQDTNRCQLDLLRLLAAPRNNLAVVGDDDQSIYGWRGAESRNILQFSKHFPGAQVIKLEENYRSTAVVLSAANAVIANNPSRHEKTLWTAQPGGALIDVVACPDEKAEAECIAAEIDRLCAEERYQLRDFAILYRSNSQTAAVEEALRQARIAYRVVGGQAFFDRREIKDATAYLKLLVFPHDELALRRIINYPPRGLGPKAIERLSQGHRRAQSRQASLSLWDVLLALSHERESDLFGELSVSSKVSAAGAARRASPDEASEAVEATDDTIAPRTLAALGRFVDVVQRYRTGLPAALHSGDLHAHCTSYLRDMGMQDELIRSGPTRLVAERRLRNLDEFVQSLARNATREGPSFNLHAHLQKLSLSSQDADAEDELRDEVTLSTLHGSKGLEFRVVFMCGFEEGLLPHSRSVAPRLIDQTLASGPIEPSPDDGGPPSDVDEERRLCYVGITRARERLMLLYCRERNGRMELRSPSRFLSELPKELLIWRDLDMPGSQPTAKNQQALAMDSLAKMLALGGE
ncbi:MAG: UvrD-helicase domain-containing protein [Myxococcales bacterium]|nr:UvrD-helicase domain-containing protein [Myxococcales bacterium]